MSDSQSEFPKQTESIPPCNRLVKPSTLTKQRLAKPLPQYPCKVLILFNQPVLETDHPLKESEHEVEYIVNHTLKTLLAAGMNVDTLPVGRDRRAG